MDSKEFVQSLDQKLELDGKIVVENGEIVPHELK
jgi:hypothetical protein